MLNGEFLFRLGVHRFFLLQLNKNTIKNKIHPFCFGIGFLKLFLLKI